MSCWIIWLRSIRISSGSLRHRPSSLLSIRVLTRLMISTPNSIILRIYVISILIRISAADSLKNLTEKLTKLLNSAQEGLKDLGTSEL